MSNRKNKAIDVEIKAVTDQLSEVNINKNTLGQIDESGTQIQVQLGPNC